MPIVACAALGLAAARVPVLADEAHIALPIYEVPTVAPHGSIPAERPYAANTETSARPGNPRPAFELRRTSPRFAMIELPPEAAPPGTGYKRPHHALGYRWPAAESWLRDHGVDAQSCYLPMVRLHTKIRSDGPSGTLWVYGRCAFK
jgi:hypothetical protein